MRCRQTTGTRNYAVVVETNSVVLGADIGLPAAAQSLVIFAHGSGSSRHSLRNRRVAAELNFAGIATMLVDLLSKQEEAEDRLQANLRFDIPFLATRLRDVSDWAHHQPMFQDLALGYFGASTGAAAAIEAAAAQPRTIQAIVSRGGRPDLAENALPRVHAATLFIVGGADAAVLEWNRQALDLLPKSTVQKLEIVAGATHLFEEPGALETVANLARNWFLQHLNFKENS